MLNLIGNSLAQRQKELNEKVKEATEKNIDFGDIKGQSRNCDIDTLFTIDVASNLKNIVYILEVLKSGDSLHISRALRNSWLYDDAYSNFINTDYLHENVFPFMSIKMKNKMLTTASQYIHNEERAASFYTYCATTLKMNNIAFKFLIHTSNSFKMDVIMTNTYYEKISSKGTEYIKHFFGNCFANIESYLKSLDYWQAVTMLYKVRYFYFLSNIKYLELLEKYQPIDPNKREGRLGLRITKDIMTKNKDKVLKKPMLYLTVLNRKNLVKYSTIDDAKVFAIALLPCRASKFWSDNYYQTYKYILDKIPKQELFAFLKNIFTNKYPGEEFEMSVNFYRLSYYDILTEDERELWALRHMENQEEMFGSGQDYIWCRFVHFDKAFPEIKKYVLITPDSEQRADMVNTLIESTRTQSDLVKLFQYYYQRHINECQRHKITFLDIVIDKHNVFEFDEKCWDAFNKLLYSMEVYNNLIHGYNVSCYRVLVVLYCIVNDKDIPDTLTGTLYSSMNLYDYKEKLTEEKREKLFQGLRRLYVQKISELLAKRSLEIRTYIDLVINLLEQFKKSKDDCPEIVYDFIRINWDRYKYRHLFSERKNVKTLTEQDLMRSLKKDTSVVASKLLVLKTVMNYDLAFKMNQLTRKLNIYFANDLAKEYFNFFIKLLSEPDTSLKTVRKSVYCIFQLADDKFIKDFMIKYAPSESKIDHKSIEKSLLNIQNAICRYLCYTRPPVPLSLALMYLRGDYVHFCLPLFNHYYSNLPLPLSIKFLEAVLNAPLSIQKHGLRLAFKLYSTVNLKQLLLSVWNKTKNVSLRMILYKSLYDRIQNEDESSQAQLYEVLKLFTSELHQDDHDDIFVIFSFNNIPHKYKGDFLETAWLVVSTFIENKVNIKRQITVLRGIIKDTTYLDRNFIRVHIIDPHIQEMLVDSKIQIDYKPSYHIGELMDTKWNLISKYIVTCESIETSEENAELIAKIVRLVADNWNKVNDNQYTVRKFCSSFITTLINDSNAIVNKSFIYVSYVFEKLLATLVEKFRTYELFLIIWNLQLQIILRKVLAEFDCTGKIGPFKNLPCKQVCDKYAYNIGQIIVGLIDSGQLATLLLPQMAEILKEHINVLSRAIDVQCNKLEIHICDGLLNIVTPEIYLLVLRVLSTDCDSEYYQDYKILLDKVKMFENDEVQFCLYCKFVNSDFKKRSYV